jgi:hypothetical protein
VIRALLFFGLLAGAAPPLSGRPFDFSRFTRLEQGDFLILTSGAGRIGSGQLTELSGKRMALSFSVKLAAISIQGQMSLTPLATAKSAQIFLLRYAGKANGKKESSEEKVSVPQYLLDQGILSFSYQGGRRFFQLSVNKHGHNIFITDWGAARLTPAGR